MFWISAGILVTLLANTFLTESAYNSAAYKLTDILSVAAFGLIGILLFKAIHRRADARLFAMFMYGAFLRFVYVLSTPHTLRGYDTEGHIDYIRFVASNLRIPEAANGWEFHQAPLYYLLTGLWMRTSLAIGSIEKHIFVHLQAFSAIASIVLLAVGVWIAHLLFSKKTQSVSRAHFVLGLATIPALVFLSSRITNNGLYHLFAFLVVAFCLAWWKSGELKHWVALCLAIAFSILTKVSGLMFLPIVALLLLFRRNMQFSRRIKYGVLGLAVIIAFTWWLPVIRFGIEEDSRNSISFGSQNMHTKLRVPSDLENFTVFNPRQMLSTPFNDPWSETERREYFWEYFFRSAFFGEFRHNETPHVLVVGTLLTALLLLPLCLWGAWLVTVRQFYVNLPITLLSVFTIAAHLTYRIRAPFSANQDFRFSIILLIPLLYYIVSSFSLLPKQLQKSAHFLFVLFCLCSSGFLLSL